MAAVADPEVTLRYEEDKRKLAAVAAFVAGILALGSVLLTNVFLSGVSPRSFLLSVERVGGGEQLGGLESLRTATFQALDDQRLVLVAGGLALALSAAASAYVLRFLVLGARARSGAVQTFVLYLPIIGGVILFVGAVGVTFTRAAFFGDGAAATSVSDIADVEPASINAGAQYLQFVGQLVLGLGFLLASLNAMRVGLLTRFMGVMGIFAGALVVLPGQGAPVLQFFWFVAIGFLFLRVWPGGAIPPAWSTGYAEPWPSAAEERQMRRDAAEARKAGKGRGAKPAPPEPAAVEARVAEGKLHPSSKKKRKRRG